MTADQVRAHDCISSSPLSKVKNGLAFSRVLSIFLVNCYRHKVN